MTDSPEENLGCLEILEPRAPHAMPWARVAVGRGLLPVWERSDLTGKIMKDFYAWSVC